MILLSAWLGGFVAWLSLSLIARLRFRYRVEMFAAAAIWPLVIIVHLFIFMRKALNGRAA